MIPAADEQWKDRAACVGRHDLMLEPHVHRGEIPSTPWPTREARRLCAGCPVRAACLEYAYTIRAEHDLYGGLTPKERQRQGLMRPVSQEARVREAGQLHNEGLSAAEICCRMGLSKSTVRQYLNRAGIYERTRRRP